MSEETILEVKDLCKSFDGIMAVNHVNLSIGAGSLEAIIGPNGAGKSTLFNLITGYYACDSGTVLFKKEDITRKPPDAVSRRGIIRSFQRTNIFPRLTVFENVQIAVFVSQGRHKNLLAPAKNTANERTDRILEDVGLLAQAGQIASTLAHGDQKRLEIAITLGSEPKLMLLDEPTAGMSREETFNITRLIEKINREHGLTIIFTEHDMEVVFDIAQQITVLHHGTVICHGNAADVRQNREVQCVYLGESK